MVRILITGERSYVGGSLKKWLSQWPDKYSVDCVSVRDDAWKEIDFSNYDVVFHVASIVHKREKPAMRELYYKVNKDLTIEIAKLAKQSGIKQFIFMSSMSVYGLEGKINESVVIKKETPCVPKTFYGKSKLEAEQELTKMSSESFKVAIIRAPMIYGPGCPGNYTRLRAFILRTPIFPAINNQRSMLYIDNLSEFVRLLIDNKNAGMFFPQNKEYVDTLELVKLIAKENSNQVYISKVLAFWVNLFGARLPIFNKVFGNLVFDLDLSQYKDFEYCSTCLQESVRACEKNINRC